MTTAQEKYAEMQEKIKKMQEEMQEKVKSLFNEIVTEFFAANPKIKSFSWTQYTPYFNDGEECVFGVNSYDPTMIFVEESGLIDTEKWEIAEEGEARDLQKATQKFIDGFRDEDLKTIFGDHVEVTVNNDGTAEVEEYSHD